MFILSQEIDIRPHSLQFVIGIHTHIIFRQTIIIITLVHFLNRFTSTIQHKLIPTTETCFYF